MTDLATVAKQAGVSRATAARAFSQPDLVRPETSQKVFAAARKLGFRPNHLGRQLRTQATHIIGVLIPSLDNPVFAEQLQAMEVAARERGYALLIATTDYDPEREADIVEELLRQRVDGLIMTVADAHENALLRQLDAENIPYLLVYNQLDTLDAPCVCVDNRQAMFDATRHLQQLGHRHIGMVAGPMLQSDRAKLRYQGYCQAMLAQRHVALPIIEMPQHTRSSFEVLAPWLDNDTPLTALLCSNDLLAISVIGDLQRAGLRVPDQVSVIGFDGIALGEQLCPSLCSVVQPRQAIGRAAVEGLLALMGGEQARLEKLPHQLRLGESVGPLPWPN
ncbi:GntR family transcriptional regulator [Zobellella endophytica]|uniref:GntR family transcriptional regulator n=1 Tax=Zobellella endophytica TaxID=2116700 RepID=A0A2P7R8E5_9GAMM|nr:LacI family DNA-binding transcriptional regulator [Zobellella endophytica]PSJ46469.1 GntR family transcriptional regulator [Zobellella endophytica]